MSEHKPDDIPESGPVPAPDPAPEAADPADRAALPRFLSGPGAASAATGATGETTKQASRPAARQRNSWWVVILVAIAAAAGWWGWQQYTALQSAERRAAEWQAVADMLSGRIEALDGELNAARERQRNIETRIGENAATSRVIREEMLAISERSEAVEQALAKLASQREQADVAMRLNEIDFLLQLGQQRFELYAERDAAADAFRTAEDALGMLQINGMAAVQQTLSAERAAIDGLPADPRPALRSRLGDLQRRLPGLPEPPEVPTTAADQPRIVQLLSRLVTVRRIGEQEQLLTPLERASRMAALQLQFDLALAALEAGDQSAWSARLDAARLLFDGLFDAEAPATIAARHLIEEARAASVAHPKLELGAALRELRALRGMPQLPPMRAPSAGEARQATEPLEVE